MRRIWRALGMSTCRMRWSVNPQCQSRVGVALCLPCYAAVAGPSDGHHPATSRPQIGLTAGGADRCPEGGDPQSGELSYVAALVCDPSARSGVRHSDGAGITRAQRRQYDDDIHSRAQSGWSWGQESSRPPGGDALTGACQVRTVSRMMSHGWILD